MIAQAHKRSGPPARLSHLLRHLGISRSLWYAPRREEPKKPGRRPKPVPEDLVTAVRQLAEQYPWWGHKRIAVIARRPGIGLTAGLLQRRQARKVELYQAAKLLELLPHAPNEFRKRSG